MYLLKTRFCPAKATFQKSFHTATVLFKKETIVLPDRELPESDEFTNVTPRILSKLESKIHTQKNHPLCLLRERIENVFLSKDPTFKTFTGLDPITTVENNFDRLLIPEKHSCRSHSDTYYFNKKELLRTHTSCHQNDLLSQGVTRFLVSGNVFRRDEIDASHYPVFHQMEGVKLYDINDLKELSQTYGLPLDASSEQLTISKPDVSLLGERETAIQPCHRQDITDILVMDLKETLELLARELFGDVPMRWEKSYFPFTHPGYELEIEFQGKWLEVLGCGVIEQQILLNSGNHPNQVGWAFGLGLERLAMVLFDIPDIRLFWSTDDRFLSQFSESNRNIKFKPFSKHMACFKDVSMWVPKDFSDNDFCDIMRTHAGDLVENVEKIDQFVHPKTGRESRTFRVAYRSWERNLTNEQVNEIHESTFDDLTEKIGVELRM